MIRAIALAVLASPLAAQEPPPADAAVRLAVETVILPQVAGFADAAEALAQAAQAGCGEPLREPFRAAWAAWAPIADLRLGPSEEAALSIAFWPDERGAGQRALDAMIAAEDPAGLDPAAFAEVSVAARGLVALDYLLFDAEAGDGYACALTRTAAADLAAQAGALEAAWADHAALLVEAGATGNATYMSPDEAWRALYTQVLAGLEFTADARLGRPLGEFDRPRPTRAEAWRSGMPLRTVVLATDGAYDLAAALGGAPDEATQGAMAAVTAAAEAVGDDDFQDIADPHARLRVEILQGRVRALRDAIEAGVGAPRGIGPGFNSQDGD